MAGGIGSRFWPWSRTNTPKQFLDILNTGRTLLQQTFDRLMPFCPAENVYIVTHENYKEEILRQLPKIKSANVLLEPQRRNTAPCIAYAAYKINKKNKNANMIVVPADHIIQKEERFARVATAGLEYVSAHKVLLTIGILPHRPETGYGYIKTDAVNIIETNTDYTLCKVSRFEEKPNHAKAVEYLKNGNYKWNSGMFIWSVKSILDAMEAFLPDVNKLFYDKVSILDTKAEVDAIKDIYDKSVSISIDYGIMEKADNVYSMSTDIGWSDVGTWGSLYEYSDLDSDENALNDSKTLLYKSNNCFVKIPDEKVAAIYGLNDFIVVDTKEALLICPKSEEQNIRNIVEDVKNKFGNKYA